MIVWNVANRWFATKAECEACRRDLRLGPAATQRAEIVTREQLAALLDFTTAKGPPPLAKPPKLDPRQTDLFGDTAAGLAAINRADGGADITMRHENVVTGAAKNGDSEPQKEPSPSPLTAAISTGDERNEPPIERTPQAFDDWEPDSVDPERPEPDERRLLAMGDGTLYDQDTGEVYP